MSEKPNRWYCDECGEPITRAKDGWLEWRKVGPNGERSEGFRIVHHFSASPRASGVRQGGCYYSEPPAGSDVLISNMHLEHFTDPLDGLARLTTSLQPSGARTADTAGVLEVIRRLHVPLWEEARRLWPLVAEDWDGWNGHAGPMPFDQELLTCILREAANAGDERAKELVGSVLH